MLSQATENTTGKELASEAYRQVSYAMTQYAATAGGITEALTSHSSGIYYYTGTGSVSNLTSSGGNYAYTYSEYGARTVYRTDADGYTGVIAVSYTYEGYGYNGEYTHEALGIQYLRARYYSMGTGTFTSKDTYAGRIESILSQNRYTYVENNPVNFADPSGHAKGKGGLSSLEDNIRIANGGNGPAYKQPVNNPQAAAKAAYQKRREDAGLPNENTLLDNIRVMNDPEYYNNILAQASLNALLKNGFSATDFVESEAFKVELIRCAAYSRCKNASQEKIFEGFKKGETKYYIYYLNNIDGAKSFGHNAILLVNRFGEGEFYSYMGGGENLWQTATQETGGYFWHGHMNKEEVQNFLKTGNINVQMGNGQINFDNYDRALVKELNPKEYGEVMSRVGEYEKNPPAYQLFFNNCDNVSIEIIGNLAEDVDMIEVLPNNSFYLRSQVWEDWQFVEIGENSISENIFEIPGGYYILRGLLGR